MFTPTNRATSSSSTTTPVSETTPLRVSAALMEPVVDYDDDDDDDDEYMYDEGEYEDGDEYFHGLKGASTRRESMMADKLSMRLLAVPDDDSDAEAEILNETLNLATISGIKRDSATVVAAITSPFSFRRMESAELLQSQQAACKRLSGMVGLVVLGLGLLVVAFFLGVEFIGPPNQPVGPYELVERQEGEEFFQYYTFYEGPDSVGSNGYINYVSRERANRIEIANITHEVDELDVFYTTTTGERKRRRQQEEEVSVPNATTSPSSNGSSSSSSSSSNQQKKEPFLYLKTAPTEAGPRESIRLEGKRRFNRGLFIIDVRHMPAGCGVWPAFWLTDEANWPVNGEIDIVEGVNYQSEAKTALHSTKGCDMFDVPMGTMTGTWDSATGIPDRKTGIPDMTAREAQNCFVYDPHQWLNQGCVAVDKDGGSLGIPLNENGGGIFALEWDPVNRHMRTWVFTPHTKVPENLVQAIRTAQEPTQENRVMPNPEEWPLPYGYFPIADGTNCPGSHFRNMRLVLNTAFCGSVSGNRFFLDCKNESKTHDSCNAYIKSEPKALEEAYWKIRGVYVYQRSWKKAWIS